MSEKNNLKKTREPKQNRSHETKGKILNAGRTLFIQKGYQQTNTKEICNKAGVAVGSFYAYYQNKGELFLDIVEIYYRKTFEEVEAVREKLDPSLSLKQIIGTFVKVLFRAHEIDPGLHREVSMMILAGANKTAPQSDDQKLFKKIHDHVESLDKRIHTWVEDLLTRWLQGKTDRDPSLSAALLFRVSDEIVHRLKQLPESMPEPDKFLDELIFMFECYLERSLEKGVK